MYFLGENDADLFQYNIVKYTMRHDAKNGREDLCKAMRNLEMYIKKVYDADPNWAGKSNLPEKFK